MSYLYMFAFGVLIGVLATLVYGFDATTHNTVLDKVGIDRIEHCHNTKSNWYEIIWKENHGK